METKSAQRMTSQAITWVGSLPYDNYTLAGFDVRVGYKRPIGGKAVEKGWYVNTEAKDFNGLTKAEAFTVCTREILGNAKGRATAEAI